MRARKQLALLAATFFFPEHGTLTNVRAFHVQVDGSCQGRAGPNKPDPLVPTSTFAFSVYIPLLWHLSQLALNIIHVVCAVLDKAQTTFSKSYKPGKNNLWEAIVCFNFQVVIISAGKALMCHNYTVASLECM